MITVKGDIAMDIVMILISLLVIGCMSKWEKYDGERKYRKHVEKQKERGLYYNHNKL